MLSRSRFALLLALTLGAVGCGGDSEAPNAGKCRIACDSSSVMQCASMDSAACQRDCEALIAGLSGSCAACVTAGNAWEYALDHRMSGANGCHGYAFPSVTDSSSLGCADFCK